MEMLEAVRLAKRHIATLYEDEDISKIGLEQVEYEEGQKLWEVTVGFASPNSPGPLPQLRRSGMAEIVGRPASAPDIQQSYMGDRRYKVVQIDDETSAIRGVRDLFLHDAA